MKTPKPLRNLPVILTALGFLVLSFQTNPIQAEQEPETREERQVRRTNEKALQELYRDLCSEKYGFYSEGISGANFTAGCVQTEMNRDENLGRILVNSAPPEYQKAP